MVNYEDLSKIMIKRINEINRNFLDIDINLSLTISQELVNQIINYLISLGGIDYIRNRNGLYNNLMKPSKNKKQPAISVLSGALLVLFSGKKENEENTIKKIFDSYDKDFIIEIPTIPELDKLTPEPPLSTPREPPPEQEILDLSFVPTSAQKRIDIPLADKDAFGVRYSTTNKKKIKPTFIEERSAMGLSDFDAPLPPIEEEEEKEEIQEDTLPEEEENLTEGQKRALEMFLNSSPISNRSELAFLPNPEDEENGGEWMDYEEADEEEVLSVVILEGENFYPDSDEEEEEEEPDEEEEEPDEEEEIEEFTPTTEIDELVEETQRILDTPLPTPEIVQPNILNYGNTDGSSVPSPVVLSSPAESILSTDDLILRLGELANPISKEDEAGMTPEEFANLPIVTRKGNIVEPEQRKREDESRREKRYRLQIRRQIRNKESETANMMSFNVFDVNNYTEQPDTIKTVEELPDWLEGIMDADWTAVVPNYLVASEDRPVTGDKLLDVLERRIERIEGQNPLTSGMDVIGMPFENYTKYNILESDLDLENFVGKDWKSKMRLNLRAIQRKKMRNQPYKKDLPLGERTLPEVPYEDEY